MLNNLITHFAYPNLPIAASSEKHVIETGSGFINKRESKRKID